MSSAALIQHFVKSRRQRLSPRTLDYYEKTLGLAGAVVGIDARGQDIGQFLDALQCSNGGKHAYYRALRCFYNWLYSPKSGMKLNPQDNPMSLVDAPKVEKKILPSLTLEELDTLITNADCIRDKAIISLFADSGLRLSELANINPDNIDWRNRLIKVTCKGNKEGLAPFGEKTESFLTGWVSQYPTSDKLWDVDSWGIISMLKRLEAKTAIHCNPHTFRRTFATILAKRGVDSLHIMRLGRWESLAMVDRYTKSIRFEDSLKFYKAPLS